MTITKEELLLKIIANGGQDVIGFIAKRLPL
jgi:hypothetical protein